MNRGTRSEWYQSTDSFKPHSPLAYCLEHCVAVRHIHRTTDTQLESQFDLPPQLLEITRWAKGGSSLISLAR